MTNDGNNNSCCIGNQNNGHSKRDYIIGFDHVTFWVSDGSIITNIISKSQVQFTDDFILPLYCSLHLGKQC